LQLRALGLIPHMQVGEYLLFFNKPMWLGLVP
jgi:hypothetical protein